MKKVTDIITLEQLHLLKQNGFVVIHDQPTDDMIKAARSALGDYVYGDIKQSFHRLVAESIRSQNMPT